MIKLHELSRVKVVFNFVTEWSHFQQQPHDLTFFVSEKRTCKFCNI